MMLPGVEVARKRRVHFHEIQPWGPQDQSRGGSNPARSGMAEPALRAQIRLEEKLRGVGSSSRSRSPTSRWTRFMRDTGGATSSSRQQNNIHGQTKSKSSSKSTVSTGNNGGIKRFGSEDLCAVCLEEVKGKKEVTWLPCNHKYHSDCVLPWLASHPDCPCCRTIVEPVNS